MPDPVALTYEDARIVGLFFEHFGIHHEVRRNDRNPNLGYIILRGDEGEYRGILLRRDEIKGMVQSYINETTED